MRSVKQKKVDYISGLYQIAEDYLVYNEQPKSDFYNNISPDRALNQSLNSFNEQLNNKNNNSSLR